MCRPPPPPSSFKIETLEEIGISRADLIQAGLVRNPEFFASVRFPDRPPSGTRTEFSLTQDFLDLLMLTLRKRLAAAQFEPTRLRVSHQILQLVPEAKAAFYTYQAREQLLKRLQAIVEVNEAGVDLNLRQHEAGNITDLELANHTASFQQAKLEWGKTQAEARADRERLNRVLGLWGKYTGWKAADVASDDDLKRDGIQIPPDTHKTAALRSGGNDPWCGDPPPKARLLANNPNLL